MLYLSGLLCYIKAIYLHLVAERSIIENASNVLASVGSELRGGKRKFLLRKMLKNQDWDDGKWARDVEEVEVEQ